MFKSFYTFTEICLKFATVIVDLSISPCKSGPFNYIYFRILLVCTSLVVFLLKCISLKKNNLFFILNWSEAFIFCNFFALKSVLSESSIAVCYLSEAEDIKKRWQEYTELYKKDLHDPDIHDGVITHLEPDILECEVKWALESITTNKASGGDGIPVELFQILKDDTVNVLHSICQQIWKTQQWPQDWKRSFSFQSHRKAMPKNLQTIA